MNVETIMSKAPITVSRAASLDRAIELMDEHGVRHLPVLDGDRLAGVISDRDLLDATGWLHPSQREALEAPQGDVGVFMTAPATTASPTDTLDAALELLFAARIGCLPVLDGDKLVGVVTEIDILRSYADACRIGRIDRAHDASICDLLTPDPLAVAPGDSVADAEHLLREARVRHLPVVHEGKLVGILSDRDVRLTRGRGRIDLATVEEAMTPDPRTLSRNHRLSSAALLMSSERISALPVTTDQDELVGIATLIDVMAPCAAAMRQLD